MIKSVKWFGASKPIMGLMLDLNKIVPGRREYKYPFLCTTDYIWLYSVDGEINLRIELECDDGLENIDVAWSAFLHHLETRYKATIRNSDINWFEIYSTIRVWSSGDNSAP